ncbi:hypothetical protein Tco_0159166 [Tanacetum coccineum]
MRKEFKQGNKVLLFHSKYKFKQPKLRSRWLGPYVVKHQYPSGHVELYGKDGKTFIVNGHRLKLYQEDDNDPREAVTPFPPKRMTSEVHLKTSREVAEALPDVRVTVIDCLWSDHNPILLHVSKSDFGLAPFKIFHSWLLRDSFDEVTKTKLPKLEENNFRRKLLSHEKIQDKIEAGSANDDDHDARKKFKDYDSNVEFPLFANSSGLCALDRDSLDTPVSLDEVKNEDYIKVDILEYVNISLDTGSLSHVSNSSFFTLIPKVRIEKTKRSKNDQKPTRNGKKTKSQEQE